MPDQKPDKSGRVILVTRLYPDELEEFRRFAAKRDRSMAYTLRQMICSVLKRDQKQT